MRPRRSIRVELTAAQIFALCILLESTLSAVLPSRFTASYAAALRKLKAARA